MNYPSPDPTFPPVFPLLEEDSMNDIAHQRCFNHELREAVARCPECNRFYCRECITEHEDRVLCASCLGKLTKSSSISALRFRGVIRILQFLSAVVILWLFFYYLGQILLSVPTSFHEGTVWQGGWWSGQ
jgi:hypothetical protein